jgi:bis(5'-adenosyl)-triphosphatase
LAIFRVEQSSEQTISFAGLAMQPLTKDVIKFGSFVVTSQVSAPILTCHWQATDAISTTPPSAHNVTCSFNRTRLTTCNQVFHLSRLSIAIVNLKPLLPGHVLVSPRRVVPRFNDLSAAEVQDLFLTVHRVSRMVERVYGASSLNIAIQDGVDAGQSVPHVHAHIIPRRKDDLEEQGGTDAIYEMMESEDADLSKQLKEKERLAKAELAEEEKKGKFPAVDNDSRKPRSDEEMQKEAEWLAEEMTKDEQTSS